jgi:ribonuclease D
LELKRGLLALSVENGRVVTFDWQAADEPANAE